MIIYMCMYCIYVHILYMHYSYRKVAVSWFVWPPLLSPRPTPPCPRPGDVCPRPARAGAPKPAGCLGGPQPPGGGHRGWLPRPAAPEQCQGPAQAPPPSQNASSFRQARPFKVWTPQGCPPGQPGHSAHCPPPRKERPEKDLFLPFGGVLWTIMLTPPPHHTARFGFC